MCSLRQASAVILEFKILVIARPLTVGVVKLWSGFGSEGCVRRCEE